MSSIHSISVVISQKCVKPSSKSVEIKSSIILAMNMHLIPKALLLLLLPTLCFSCGPGRGGIRRRGARKLTPLIYKQHVPNYSERSLAASGLHEGVVDRIDAKFRRLVPNYNPDILFKDEEGTGADRLMTQRCKEKLNTLAISVMNQWPGIQLRVTESWDEDFHHSQQSLHYEGRAVDFTTSDRDKRKLGMLARLAVESGFDWVYYESKTHVHASCKSEAQNLSKSGGCFKSTSTVLTESGARKQMTELQIGDKILSVTPEGDYVFSPVILFLDRNPGEQRQFYTIRLDSGHSLTLTPEHLLYSAPDGMSDFNTVFARSIQEGDLLLVHSSKAELVPQRVVQVEVDIHTGVYAPLTTAGNLVVDNVLASCYAIVDSGNLAHSVFAPIRWYESTRQLLNGISSHSGAKTVPPQTGIHWYADMLYSIGEWLVPGHLAEP